MEVLGREDNLAVRLHVSSGVPLRNGTQHACEICSLAISLADAHASRYSQSGLAYMAGVHSGGYMKLQTYRKNVLEVDAVQSVH